MDGDQWMDESTSAETDHVVEADSLGEQIDQAIGDLDTKLSRLHQELDLKQNELSDLEVLIEATEKQQAKAFKELLSSNPKIKKLLAGKPKRKSSGRRRKTTSTAPETSPEPEAYSELDTEPDPPREPEPPTTDLL
jgi:hypothetical protein